MIDLTTQYLGMQLSSPLVCSSSPLCENLENLQRMQDSGAGAIVLHSLFEEQIQVESDDLDRILTCTSDVYAESLSFFPDMTDYNFGPEGYLEHIRQAKTLLKIPIIASLNGVTLGGWVQYAREIERAGADALELNVYFIPTDPRENAAFIEQRVVELVSAVRANLQIPIAVKLSPYFSAPVEFCRRLADVGADGFVLFNRFYQPDFDLESLEVKPMLRLSDPDELCLRLHWTAILCGQVKADLAITGGVHSARDVLKAMMAGANVAMLTSSLLKYGIEHLKTVRMGMLHWMEENEYTSIHQMQGSMSLRSVPHPGAFERANYLKVLRSYALREV